MRAVAWVDEDVVGVHRPVLDAEIVGIEPHQLTTGRDEPGSAALGAGLVVVNARHDGHLPSGHIEVLVPQPERLTDPHPGIGEQGEQQPVTQVFTGIQDGLCLDRGENPRSRLRGRQLDRPLTLPGVPRDVGPGH
jgi:hypothetical protein